MRHPRGGLRLVLVVALVGLVGPMTGCSCEDGPYLAQDSEARLAVGWDAGDGWGVTSAALLDGDQVRWQITSSGAPPAVIVLGETPTGFATPVPLAEPIPTDAKWSLRVDYTRARGGAGHYVVDDISDPDTRRPTEARVDPDQECARGWGIDLGGVARLWPWILVGSAAAILSLLVGVLGMLWVGRAVARRVRRSSGPPVI